MGERGNMLKAVVYWVIVGGLTYAVPLRAAVTIEKVLPFTPTTSTLDVQTVVAGGNGVTLSGKITPWKKSEVVWSGSIEARSLIEHLPVQPWSPGAPNLYELTVTASLSGKPLATKTVRFGFRQIESRNGNVYLNGHPIFLRGLAISPPGRTVPEPLGSSRQFAYDYVKYLRGQNLNLIRTSEISQEWFDVCDELGMMMFQGFYGNPPSGMSKEEEAAARASAKALAPVDEAEGKRLPPDFERSMKAYQEEFETYVRHPSIIIYVLTNEMPYKGKDAAAVHDFLGRAFERLAKFDHTRLYIANAGYGEGHEGDLNDVHRYWGWYYNSFLTFLNLRNPKLLGDYDKGQPLTFSECVGNFTGPTGAYNYIERKQLASALGWTGTAPWAEQDDRAQAYQGFTVKQVSEMFRRLRPINPRIGGLMPFTITFHNWRGIKSFADMKPTAASVQFGASYQPVLLSWENWHSQVYAGTKVKLFAHVINDAEDFSDLTNATLSYTIGGVATTIPLPPRVPYYGAARVPVELNLPASLASGEYPLKGWIVSGGKEVSRNETTLFVAGGEWKKAPAATARRLFVAGTLKNATAFANAGIAAQRTADLSTLDPKRDGLLIGEESILPPTAALQTFIRGGGRVLVLGQSRERFKFDWLPGAPVACEHSVNEPEYPVADRPAFDQAHVNIERPEHPLFAGVDRNRLHYWSDYTDWDETKDGFPRISPMRFGFKLTKLEDLGRVAVIGDYDSALEGIALAEFFDGNGSLLLCGLDLMSRVGVDPVADRMLANLVSYMADDTTHRIHPMITSPIVWGDFASERGVLIAGPLCGLFHNTVWQPPPTDPHGEPPRDKLSGWNTRPSDQFIPHGIRPRGPYRYTFNGGLRDDGDKAADGSGIFWAMIPTGRSSIVTRVTNPSAKPAMLRVVVNDMKAPATTTIAPGQTIEIKTPIPGGATDLGVRYTGGRELVILETSFK
jgi:beta-galactosidase